MEEGWQEKRVKTKRAARRSGGNKRTLRWRRQHCWESRKKRRRWTFLFWGLKKGSLQSCSTISSGECPLPTNISITSLTRCQCDSECDHGMKCCPSSVTNPNYNACLPALTRLMSQPISNESQWPTFCSPNKTHSSHLNNLNDLWSQWAVLCVLLLLPTFVPRPINPCLSTSWLSAWMHLSSRIHPSRQFPKICVCSTCSLPGLRFDDQMCWWASAVSDVWKCMSDQLWVQEPAEMHGEMRHRLLLQNPVHFRECWWPTSFQVSGNG